MKKILVSLMFLSLLSFPAYAAYEAYHPKEQTDNSFKVFARGIGNMAGLPAEVVTTLVRENRDHSRLWPVTYVPRLLTNIFCRAASAAHDTFILPWVAPFVDDTTPWTEGIGIPEYPWRVE